MRSKLPEKLQKIANQIQHSGSESLTRLTVLKKWFEYDPKRLQAFGLFMARRALAASAEKTQDADVAALLQETGALLNSATHGDTKLDQGNAEKLYFRLKAFQNEHLRQHWGPVRLIQNWNLFLVEEGLGLSCRRASTPSEGYRLAADFYKHDNSQYGTGLSGPSFGKIHELIRFVLFIEDQEEAQTLRTEPLADLPAAQVMIARLRGLALQRSVDLDTGLRLPPPAPDTCCGRGCNGCVWEGYFTALRQWRDDACDLLAQAL